MRALLASPVAVIAVLAACGGSSKSEVGDLPTVTSGPTYFQDVGPILSERCSGCHVAGGIAPFALQDLGDAQMHASAIKRATLAGEMPPWPPGPTSVELMNARRLSDEEKRVLAAWVDSGAQAGDPAKAAPLRKPHTVELGEPDLRLDIGTDYAPDASFTDDYHCFVVPLGTTEPRVAVGYKITPGNGQIVHHVTTAIFPAEAKAAIDAHDATSPGPGWQCFGGVQNVPGAQPVGTLGAWVPGVSSVAYPAGTGTAIPAGGIAILQVHYNLLKGKAPDRTKVEVKLAPKGEDAALQKLATVPVYQRNLKIPAGQKDVVAESTRAVNEWTLGKFYPDGDAYIMGVTAHMHLVGAAFRITVNDQTVLDIPKWDFHWQGSYPLVKPIKVGPTDKVGIRCVYDNTAEHRAEHQLGAPVDVAWGEGTHDEMCLGALSIVDDAP